jgi:hypothetical protein
MNFQYTSLTNISAYIAIGILILLCLYDFKKNIIKPDIMLIYWCALLFFIFLNIVVYVGLLNIIASVKLNLTQFYFYFSDTETKGIKFQTRLLSPIMISLLYFGTGSAKFKFHNKEFSIYERMLNIFRNMFPYKTGTEEKIEKHLKNLGDQTEKLTEKVEELHELAERNEWRIEKHQWKSIEKDTKIYSRQTGLLNQIGVELSKKPMDQSTINNIRDTITEENKNIKEQLNKKIRKYIFNSILPHVQNAKALQDVARFLGVDIHEIIERPEPQPLLRVLALSLNGGITLSITLQMLKFFELKSKMAEFAGAGYSSQSAMGFTPQASLDFAAMFYLSMSMFMFLYCFSFLGKTKYNVNGFFSTTLLGAAGGFLGHLTYIMLTKVFIIYSASDPMTLALEALMDCMWGLILGIVAAVVSFFFNHFACMKISRILLRYFGIALAGGVVYWLVFWVRYTIEVTQLSPYRHAQAFFIGFIALLCVGFVSGVLEHKGRSTDYQKHRSLQKRSSLTHITRHKNPASKSTHPAGFGL